MSDWLETLTRILQQALKTQDVVLRDSRGDSQHLELVVRSPLFVGVSRVMQHRMVYEALGDRIGGAIHALSLKTETPLEPTPEAS